MKKNIYIGSDHAGYKIKQKIIDYLQNLKYKVFDKGTHSEDSCDYPDFAVKVAKNVAKNPELNNGILICGTGVGMSITANKIKGSIASLCTNKFMAEMTKKHNNSNILCLGARVSTESEIFDILDTWLETDFEGGRHQKRIDKIKELENENCVL